MNTEDWLQQIREFAFAKPRPWPRLLYSSQDVAGLRRRAAQFPDWLEQVRQEAEDAYAGLDQTLAQDTEPYYNLLAPLEAVSAAYLLLSDHRMAAATVKIVDQILQLPQWVCHVHWPMSYDHCAANTASAVVRALDVVSDTLSPSKTEEFCRRLVDKAVIPFTQACRDRQFHWTKRETESNWRVMTCGDSGLAVLATAEFNPDLHESLAFAAEGVLDTLDHVPAEGDWPEGAGYWLGTLGLGLRFCLALYRASDGQLDLFRHRALGITGDYIAHLVKPDGSVYNFNDNRPTLGDVLAYLFLLARHEGRPDWAWVAGRRAEMSVLRLLFEDPESATEPPQSRAAFFPRTGVAMMRGGWQPKDTFVGFKSGPSDVGHSHLDANSFVLAVSGQDIIQDEGYWAQDHPHGFFDPVERRWNYDANASVGHNTVLVDGFGQTWGRGNAGRIEAFDEKGDYAYVVGEASRAYPGLLTRFRRWLVFIRPDLVVVFDELASDQPRHFEWLFHYGGSISGDRGLHVIRNGEAVATLRWLYPDAQRLWRVIDSVRTTYYQDADWKQDVAKQMHYRSMGPIHRAQSVESLLMISAGEPGSWSASAPEVSRDTASLAVAGPNGTTWQIVLDREGLQATVSKAPAPRG